MTPLTFTRADPVKVRIAAGVAPQQQLTLQETTLDVVIGPDTLLFIRTGFHISGSLLVTHEELLVAVQEEVARGHILPNQEGVKAIQALEAVITGAIDLLRAGNPQVTREFLEHWRAQQQRAGTWQSTTDTRTRTGEEEQAHG